MFFPIGDDNVKGGSFPLFSYGFILLNIAVFVFQSSLPGGQLQSFVETYGSVPHEITQGQDWFTLLTCMFLHGSWMHLIGNMLFLWIFADNIEAVIGNFRFFIFYVSGGLMASFAHIFFNWSSSVPMVGASGAISAALGAYLVLFPASRIKVLFFIFPFHVPALLFLVLWIGEQFVNGIGELNIQTAATSGVAWWAHIGGFVFGLLAGFYFRNTRGIRFELERE